MTFSALLVTGCSIGHSDPADPEASAGARRSAVTEAASLTFPYCADETGGTCSRGVRFRVADLRNAWVAWRDQHICDAARDGMLPTRTCASTNVCGRADFLRVWKPDSGNTVSEGMGYGMYLAMVFDEASVFDRLWRFASHGPHRTPNNLMHWQIGSCGGVTGTGSATDGEIEMAMGLIGACRKRTAGAWPASTIGVDACADAADLVRRIWESEVDEPGPSLSSSGADDGGLINNVGNELMPGDLWSMQSSFPAGVVNLSYFDPGAFRAFGQFLAGRTGDSTWIARFDAVTARQYQILRAVEAQAGNCSGLVNNWSTYAGACQQVPWQGGESCAWTFDAARAAFRQARAFTWYPDITDAGAATRSFGRFFATLGVNNIAGSHKLDGTPWATNMGITYFRAVDAAPVWAADVLTPIQCGAADGVLRNAATDAGRQAAYDSVLQTSEQLAQYRYYNDFWRLASLLLMSGNEPNLCAMESASGDGGTTPPDLAVAVDAGGSVDMAMGAPDLAAPRDLAVPRDLTTPPADLASGGTGTAIELLYRAGNTASSPTAVHPHFQIINRGGTVIDLTRVRIRYWFSADGTAPINTTCDWAARGCNVVNATVPASATTTAGADHFLDVGFAPGAGSIAPGEGSGEIQLRFNKTDWSPLLQTNDWSFDATRVAYGTTPRVTAYLDGALVAGSAPAGGLGCANGIRDGSETGIDCGGPCVPCPSCHDGIRNGNETGVDCGGACALCNEPCSSARVVSGGQSGNFGTTGAVCFKITDSGTINGWNCSNVAGRTVKVNGVTVSCSGSGGTIPLPAKINGAYYFDWSAGLYSWASFAWWK